MFCFWDQLDNTLLDDEHVYLCASNKQRLMKVIYVQSEPGKIVHNKSLEDDSGKFQIVEIFHESIQYWQDFDGDAHCPDTYIMWKLRCVEQKADHVLRRPEYSLEKIIPNGMLINYKLHCINCTECFSGCEMSNDTWDTCTGNTEVTKKK